MELNRGELIEVNDLRRHFGCWPRTAPALKEWLEDKWRSKHLINPRRAACLTVDGERWPKFKHRWLGKGYA